MLVFDRGGWWWWQRTTVLENKHVHLFSREKAGVAKSNQARKQARMLVFEEGGWWWWWQRTTSLKNKRICLFSGDKGGGKEQPPSKTSICTRFRGKRWWC